MLETRLFHNTETTSDSNNESVFCANFSEENHIDGLRYLSALIRFVQSNNRLN